MNIFHGVHEVRLLRRPKGVAVGYFDNWESALRAVETEPSQYKAAYFTLNPLRLPLPDDIQLNPASLRVTSHTADASDIERRVHLLIDCDPPRLPYINSTAEEKQAAREQAEHIRELPGILHRLITLCPDVIENGLRPPASVLAETDQLFTELDVTKQFRDDCLDNDANAETPAVDMEKAVARWLQSQRTAGMVVTSGHDNQAETILRELRLQPDIKYMRRRRDAGRSSDDGKGKISVNASR